LKLRFETHGGARLALYAPSAESNTPGTRCTTLLESGKVRDREPALSSTFFRYVSSADQLSSAVPRFPDQSRSPHCDWTTCAARTSFQDRNIRDISMARISSENSDDARPGEPHTSTSRVGTSLERGSYGTTRIVRAVGRFLLQPVHDHGCLHRAR
jgi:hypothetical protein